jgi:hypothetical protein
LLYDFHWDLSDAVHKEIGPSSTSTLWRSAKLKAIRTDVVVDVPESLQKALVAKSTGLHGHCGIR